MEAGDLSNRIRQNRQLRELQTKPIQPLPNVQLPSIPQNPIIQPLPNIKVPSVRPIPNPPQLPDINVPRIEPLPNRLAPPRQIATPIQPLPNLLVNLQPTPSFVSQFTTTSVDITKTLSQITTTPPSSTLSPVPTTITLPSEGISGSLGPLPSGEVHHGQNSSTESIPTSKPISEDSNASTDPYVIVGIVVGIICVTSIGLIYLRKRKFSAIIPSFSSSSTKVKPILKRHSAAGSTEPFFNARDPSFAHSLSSFGNTESSYSIALRHDSAYSYCQSLSSGMSNSVTDRSSESRPYSDSTWGSSEDGGSDLDGSSKRQEVIIYMQYPETAVLKR